MKWDLPNIITLLSGSGIIAAMAAVIGNVMGWIRFGKSDIAQVGKIKSETALDIATISEKKISEEIKISDAALQWTVNCFSRLEQTMLMLDRKQEENDKLHSIIDIMKKDFDQEIQRIKDFFNKRVKELEIELENSKKELIIEKENSRREIEILKNKIDGRI